MRFSPIASALTAFFGPFAALFAVAILGVTLIVAVVVIVALVPIIVVAAAVAIIILVVIFDVGNIAFQLVEVVLGALRGGGGMFGLFAEQGFAVFLRNLVIIGMDFAERQEPVAVAAIFDERRLQRRFDAGNLGQINIALELLVLRGLEIKLLDAVSLGDGDPGFFPVPRVDQHARGHW
jgi:hypothetical protein